MSFYIVVARIFFQLYLCGGGSLQKSFFEGGSLEIIELEGVGHAKVLWRHNQFHQPTLIDKNEWSLTAYQNKGSSTYIAYKLYSVSFSHSLNSHSLNVLAVPRLLAFGFLTFELN